MTAPLIELDGVGKRYGDKLALDRIDLRFDAGRAPVIAVAGESGSGKTTLASLLLGFIEPSQGEIRYDGKPLAALSGAARRAYRREVQAVFQGLDKAVAYIRVRFGGGAPTLPVSKPAPTGRGDGNDDFYPDAEGPDWGA